ncbi:MAG: GNAT family N-acetyltransferase [Gammaproteobacteria bacterium]|nr:MAG: GNAT family N-acetyltransferase [Gammaproteobacteria bacterium]
MISEKVYYQKNIPALGNLYLRPFNTQEDSIVIHDWVGREYAKFWGMQDYSLEKVRAEYEKLQKHGQVYLGFYQQRPAFLIEVYDPQLDSLSQHYRVEAGDVGMHILLAPPQTPIAQFSWHIFRFVMEFLFDEPQIKRVVVEPDARNEKIHRLNERAGFVYQKLIQLPHKLAHLAFCTRTQFFTAIQQENSMHNSVAHESPEHQAVLHLQPVLWSKINRSLIRKAISEFAHESIINPTLMGYEGVWGVYEIVADSPDAVYQFHAQRLCLNHWFIKEDSINKLVNQEQSLLDAPQFIIEFNRQLGIDPHKLPTYIEEISNTLYGSAYKHTKLGVSSDALVDADFQTIESAMMEGHPAFVANNGRVGFDGKDYFNFAPECAKKFKPVWLAVHTKKAHFACSEELDFNRLMLSELGEVQINEFRQQLINRNLKPEEYLFMPAHPWQWFNKLVTIFSADIAQQYLLFLGYAEDEYVAQQSIRTLYNVSHPERHYVKMSLSILNMGFMRGLSPYYMGGTPGINDWVGKLLAKDSYLQRNGFYMLRELASVGYRNPYYENLPVKETPYKKMLSALWRESPITIIKPKQRLMTMAALLHVDSEGVALLPKIIGASGLTTSAWLHRYLTAYLSPLIHCFYEHDLVFMPHGENLILVMENHVPVHAIIKDIAEEIAIMNEHLVLPEMVQRVQIAVPEEMKVLSIFIDVFDGFFRYLNQILVEHMDFPEQHFWKLVAQCIYTYQDQHPALEEKFKRYDFFMPEFAHSCLNRLQLVNNQQMISDLMEQADSLQFAGNLPNPIAQFKRLSSVNSATNEILSEA